MKLLIFVMSVVACSATNIMADSIELWNGTVIQGIEIAGAKEGKLSYRAEGQTKSIALTDVRNLSKGNGNCQIVRFVDYIDKRKDVKLLTIRVDEFEKTRIRRPLVRLFSCIKNKRGTYEVTLYTNSRNDDPTNAGELEEVSASDFLNRHYILTKPEGLAFRVEIWRDGILQTEADYGNTDGSLPLNWFRTFEVKSTRSLRIANDIVDEKAVEELEEDPEAPAEKGWGIDSVSVLPEVLDTIPRLKVDFSILNAMENETKTPKVVFHYVTEDGDGNKAISSVTITGNSGKEVTLVDGRYKGSVQKKLPSKLRLTKLEAQKKSGLVQLVHWRVELTRDDKVLAVKEKGGRAKSEMPDKWWQ